MGKGVPGETRGPIASAQPQRSRYRICQTNPPEQFDFLSHVARGIELRRPTPGSIDLSKGVSVWETEDQARQLAVRLPDTGAYIAEVAIPQGIRMERHGRAEGHWTVWAAPELLLRWVVRVVPVR